MAGVGLTSRVVSRGGSESREEERTHSRRGVGVDGRRGDDDDDSEQDRILAAEALSTKNNRLSVINHNANIK